MTAWANRDLPVLRALATTPDENVRRNHFLHLSGEGENALGLDLPNPVIITSIQTLTDVDYVQADIVRQGHGAVITHLLVTGNGQRALGEWPLARVASPETLARLLEELARRAPAEDAEALRQAAGYVRTLTGDLVRSALVTLGLNLARSHVPGS